jgi:hypothetical protein
MVKKLSVSSERLQFPRENLRGKSVENAPGANTGNVRNGIGMGDRVIPYLDLEINLTSDPILFCLG